MELQKSAGAVLLAAFGVSSLAVSAIADEGAQPSSVSGRVVRSARDGAWSVPETWENGITPAAGDRVVIRAAHAVEYDVESDQAIRVLQITGTFRFRTDRNTRLDVGLIRIEQSKEPTEEGFECDGHMADAEQQANQSKNGEGPKPLLQIGTRDRPVEARYRALIRLVAIPGMNPDSCPALVCCGGRTELHGAPMPRTWVKLAETTPDEANQLVLAEEVTGWRPGQQVLIPTTARLFIIGERGELIPTVETDSESEERTITAVSGDKLTLDRPLAFRHTVEEDYRG